MTLDDIGKMTLDDRKTFWMALDDGLDDFR